MTEPRGWRERFRARWRDYTTDKPYVLRVPPPGQHGKKESIRRWHRVNMARVAWTECNIPIGERWERSATLPDPLPTGEVMCHWCFPR